MSFLFGKKKEGKEGKEGKDGKEGKEAKTSASPAPRDIHSAQGNSPSAPQLNGIRGKDRGPGVSSPAPGSGLNSSIGSVEAGNAPPTEHNHEGRNLEHEIQQTPPRSLPIGPPNPATLYPWSQRRPTFTSSQPSPYPRYGAAVNATSSKEGEVYLMGGLVNGSTVKGDLWMIEAGGANLACYPIGTTFEGPGPRVGHASLLVGNAFIVFGGDTKMDESDKLDDTLYLLNTSTRHWSRAMPPGPRPPGRYGHTLNISGSKIYVFGGQVEGYFFNDLIAFDLNALQNAASHWEVLIKNTAEGGPQDGMVPPARTNHTIVTWNEKLYLFGGTNGTTWFNDVWAYDAKTIAWTQLDCIGYIPAPREGHSAALVGDVMYIFGGRTEEGTDLGDLAAFRISSRRWYTFQNMGPSPSPRSGHSMTAYGKQIIVMAGEPSSAPRDPGELSLIYVLDTAKIRYPNDQQIQQTPAGERVPGNRRPSQERGMGQARGIAAPSGPPEPMNRKFSGSRESMATSNSRGPPQGLSQVQGPGPAPGQSPGSGPGPGPGPGPGGIGGGPSPQGRGPSIPRASMAQTTPGPPPQQSAPAPRTNGIVPQMNGPRSRTPTRDGRGYGPPIDTGRQTSFENDSEGATMVSPVGREGMRSASGNRAISPAVNGRRTPQQQQQQQPLPLQQQPRFQSPEEEDPQRYDPNAVRSKSRQLGPEPSSDDTNAYRNQQKAPPVQLNEVNDIPVRSAKAEPSVPVQQFQQIQAQHQGLQSQHEGLQSQHEGLRSQHEGLQSQHEGLRTEHQGLRSQHESLQQELEAAKNRNAWYASEMALARKAGYQPNASSSPTLDEKAAQSFGDDDQPLLEALVAVRTELAEVRESISERESAAAKELAEVEHQRENAIREAAIARAKLAAHGGMSDGDTIQSGSLSREMSNEDRSGDMSKKFAASLTAQNELQMTIATMTNDLHNEKRARELAESSAEAAHTRIAEFDQSRNPGELESLRMELHQVAKQARDEASQRSEAHSRLQMLDIDHSELTRKHEEAQESLQTHATTLVSLREAVTASTDKSSLLQGKLDEERRQRSLLDQKLLKLRSEHEERTAELDETTRKLRDAEEMVNTHAAEAKTHRMAVVAGLDKLSSRGLNDVKTPVEDERVPVLKQQVENAQGLVKKHQADADATAEKLRKAEERIAGLEAYQEQVSRESLGVRKQLTDTLRESQGLQSRHTMLQRDLEDHRRDADALALKHSALKELLDEKGITEGGRTRGPMDSGMDTPEHARLRELEQNYEAEVESHRATKTSVENQTAETERTYREKLELLENDYQSAVSYVKGTEKMLKRMKDELTKYKQKNDRLQGDLESVQRNNPDRSAEMEAWESERQAFTQQISGLQQQTHVLSQQLQTQTSQITAELAATRAERDHYRKTHESSQVQLTQTTQQARAELEQLKSENSMLESRALDAEEKVTVLLDQVSTSVGNYRRQSQNLHNGNINGVSGHSRNLSGISGVSGISGTSSNPPVPSTHSRNISEDPTGFPDLPEAGGNNRNSVALDTLASELETLRSHWEDSHRNYRLSNQFDFERTANKSSDNGGVMDESLANWRKRLSADHGVKGGLPRLSSEDEGDGQGRKEERESAIVKPHDRMPGTISSDESDDDDEQGGKSYVI